VKNKALKVLLRDLFSYPQLVLWGMVLWGVVLSVALRYGKISENKAGIIAIIVSIFGIILYLFVAKIERFCKKMKRS